MLTTWNVHHLFICFDGYFDMWVRRGHAQVLIREAYCCEGHLFQSLKACGRSELIIGRNLEKSPSLSIDLFSSVPNGWIYRFPLLFTTHFPNNRRKSQYLLLKSQVETSLERIMVKLCEGFELNNVSLGDSREGRNPISCVNFHG